MFQWGKLSDILELQKTILQAICKERSGKQIKDFSMREHAFFMCK